MGGFYQAYFSSKEKSVIIALPFDIYALRLWA